MIRNISWFLFAFLAIAIGLYPALYLFSGPEFGFLGSKPRDVLSDPAWLVAFNTHIFFGGMALLTGWSQFSKKLRARRLNLHRNLGKTYVVAAVLSGLAGIYLSFYANFGWIPGLGFFILGVLWLFTTIRAYQHIRAGRTAAHRKAMTYSYAACFAAVMLRLWLPVLVMMFGDLGTAYTIVAWWCWIPNMGVAWWLVRRL